MRKLIEVLKRNANTIGFGDVTGKGKSIVLHSNLLKEDLEVIENDISYAGMICYLTKGYLYLSEIYLDNLQKSLDELDKNIISEKQFVYVMFLRQQDDSTYDLNLFNKVVSVSNLKSKEDVKYSIDLFKRSADRIQEIILNKIEYRF